MIQLSSVVRHHLTFVLDITKFLNQYLMSRFVRLLTCLLYAVVLVVEQPFLTVTRFSTSVSFTTAEYLGGLIRSTR